MGFNSRVVVELPQPTHKGSVSLEETLNARRSVREFASIPLTLKQLSQILWAGQGQTHPRGLRTAPSAGALYPLELVVAAGLVTDLPAGVYRYRPRKHNLSQLLEGDQRRALAAAAVGQNWISDAAAIVAVAAVYGRTTKEYGKRGVQYVHIDVGHAAQNVCLQAVALGFGSTVVGAFDDSSVKQLLALAAEEEPVELIPIGRPR
ncbi:MAG: SagB/ThcOx family dehydrogenase [Gemmatimonadota bacterium]|nr:MAG: SagB/ThcOx family dehydrogenase [Gemmatimonadota bacterium]